jgi:hypothetical protein
MLSRVDDGCTFGWVRRRSDAESIVAAVQRAIVALPQSNRPTLASSGDASSQPDLDTLRSLPSLGLA